MAAEGDYLMVNKNNLTAKVGNTTQTAAKTPDMR